MAQILKQQNLFSKKCNGIELTDFKATSASVAKFFLYPRFQNSHRFFRGFCCKKQMTIRLFHITIK